MSGPTSNGMAQDASDRESAQFRRYNLVICLPRCHGNTIATSHWLNLWERCRLYRYKVAGRRSSVRLYILFTWPYFCFMLKKKESKNQFFLFWGTSSCRSRSGFVYIRIFLFYVKKKRIKEPVFLVLGNKFLSFTFGIRSLWTNRSRPTHPQTRIIGLRLRLWTDLFKRNLVSGAWFSANQRSENTAVITL